MALRKSEHLAKIHEGISLSCKSCETTVVEPKNIKYRAGNEHNKSICCRSLFLSVLEFKNEAQMCGFVLFSQNTNHF